jgi:hypothetical protein
MGVITIRVIRSDVRIVLQCVPFPNMCQYIYLDNNRSLIVLLPTARVAVLWVAGGRRARAGLLLAGLRRESPGARPSLC